ncbi:prephenate dehydrogenase/arogenate dehydrogenase family protein [Candidatus Uhrbacteria bacterium]|nr:prephenate dehydrogenase/arogenate dehydrogenase family protein [Candidatus Uhrbacteria bacterium]
MKNKITIGVIGYGRFGKLWTSCLTSFGTILVHDKRGVSARIPRGVRFANLEEVVKTDMLFLLVPISQIESCCRDIAPLLQKHTLVIDGCSVKLHPARLMKKLLPKNQPLIATHPLFGPDSGKNGVAGKKIVLHRLRATPHQMKVFESMLKTLGLVLIHATPLQHDKAMARSQALVHLIGRSLEPLRLRQQRISTPDYESLLSMQTMVRHDSWQLFSDMQHYNPYTRAIRKKLFTTLTSIEKSLIPSP